MAAASKTIISAKDGFDAQLEAACRTPDVFRDCEVELVLAPGTPATRDHVVGVAKQFVPSWEKLDVSDFTVTQLQGGVTNVLHLVSLTSESHSPRAVLVRVFGANTEQIINRERDNLSLRFLAQEGIGPPYFGRFRNGRIEGFLAGAKTLAPKDMRSEAIVALVAQSVARMHRVALPGLQHTHASLPSAPAASAAAPASSPSAKGELTTLLWHRLDSWMDQADTIAFAASQAATAARFAAVMDGGGCKRMRQEIEWMRTCTAVGFGSGKALSAEAMVRTGVDGENAGVEVARARAASFMHETVYCHNDLLPANMLLLELGTPEERVCLVDMEYSGPNCRAMDVANHFCEYSGLDFRLEELYPASLEAKMPFLEPYLAGADAGLHGWVASEASAEEQAAFWTECARHIDEHALASHAMWGVWSVVQARWSTVEFDFIGYAALRWEKGFLFHKAQLFPDEASSASARR
jgi:ethanolamine kinase